ncbi:hypothetical protein [Nocardioides montaniterrae]
MAEDVQVQFRALYRAGTHSFPATASEIGTSLQGIGDVYHQWKKPVSDAGSPASLVKALDINAEIYHLLRRAELSWQDAAHGVLGIARDFERSDSDAAAAMHRLGIKEQDLQPPPMATPPKLNGDAS